MTWPNYPTYRENILVAQRSGAPLRGSNLRSIFLGQQIRTSRIINLPAGNIGDITLDLELPTGVTLILQGATTTTEVGTISAVTPTVPATNTRGNVTNTGGDPVFVEATRLRLTSGASVGALAWVTGVVGGNVARVSRWGRVDPLVSVNPTIVEPAIGDTYAVDTFQTTLSRLDIRVRGPGRLLVRDCIVDSGGAFPAHRLQNDQLSLGGVYMYSCRFAGAAATFYEGQAALVSCQVESICAFSNMVTLLRNSVFRGGTVSLIHGTTGNFGRSNCFDASSLTVQGALAIFTDTDIQFVDQPAGPLVAIDIFPGGTVQADANAVAWGADNGAMASAIRCRSGTSYLYANVAAKPTIPGGLADVNLGGALFAYAAIPAINPANNAQMVVLQ